MTVKLPVVHGTAFDRIQSIDTRQCLLILDGAIMGSVGFIPTYTGIQSISDVLSFMVNSTTVQLKPKLIFSQGVYSEYIYSLGEVGASVRQRYRTF